MIKKKNKKVRKASERLPLNNPILSEAQYGDSPTHAFTPARPQGAALSTAEINQISEKSHIDAFEEEVFFDDLQPLFDDHTRRLAAILDRPEARPTSLNFSDARTFRLRMARAWGILALLCIAVTLFWGIALWHFNYDIYYRLFTLFLELVYILLTVESVVTTLAILRHDPARVSFDRMLRFTRCSSMRPLYMSQKKSRLAAYIAALRRRRPSPRTLSYAFNPQFVIDNLKRTATIGIAASFTLVLIACTTTVGDGYTITQDHPDRSASVEKATMIITKI